MSVVGAAILLVLTWLALTGSLHASNVLLAFIVAIAVLLVMRRHLGGRPRRFRPLAIIILFAVFVRELALSAWTVAILVLRPRMALRPGIIAFPLRLSDDFEIALLANLITLTPGTLSIDVSDDRKLLYIHALDCGDPEALKLSIADGFERLIMEAFH